MSTFINKFNYQNHHHDIVTFTFRFLETPNESEIHPGLVDQGEDGDSVRQKKTWKGETDRAGSFVIEE